MENQSEILLAKVDERTNNLQKVSDDHEERIRSLEDISAVVSQLATTASEQSKTMDKLKDVVEGFGKTQNAMIEKAERAEWMATQTLWYKTKLFFKKNTNIKWIIVTILSAGGLTGIADLVMHLFK